MSDQPKTLLESLGRLLGSAMGFTIASVCITWVGLYVLNYLNWLPL
jgi:hypothetical protein